MNRSIVLSALAAAALALSAGASFAQSVKLAKAPTAHHATTHAAAAAEIAETATPTQIEIARRVMTGDAHCEFNQHVSVQPFEGRPGFFKVAFKSDHFIMAPQETTTGAVRLEDKRAGVVWLQIPSKSMLLNNRLGQRMVDSCTQTQQRAGL